MLYVVYAFKDIHASPYIYDFVMESFHPFERDVISCRVGAKQRTWSEP